MSTETYDQIITIEMYNINSYFSFNLLVLNEQPATPTPMSYENLLAYESLSSYSDFENFSNYIDMSEVEKNKFFIKDLEQLFNYKFNNILVGKPSVYLAIEEIINFTDACWEYVYEKSAANLKVKIDYKMIESDTFIFTESFKDWFLNLIFNKNI